MLSTSISSSNMEYHKLNSTADMDSIVITGRKFIHTFDVNKYPEELQENLTRDEFKDVLGAFNRKLRWPLLIIGVGGFFLSFLISGLITIVYGKKLIFIIPIFVVGAAVFLISTYFSYKFHKQLVQLAELYTNFYVLKSVCFVYDYEVESQAPKLTIKYRSSAKEAELQQQQQNEESLSSSFGIPMYSNQINRSGGFNNPSYSISITNGSSNLVDDTFDVSSSLQGTTEPTTGFFKLYTN
ncbi:hypothetical protein PPL_11342 [Heterostelium album PN500]|uniref:Uncharacterized protein n=1 Tax=Heterostelium pallidum (strain ATCC 26659 / Pp 5 / PN500) TaxID=670386 RepID=D3BT50_HETP5|nr:hypothetical protein PPL_11342 [Heterostelium album PN500]EFA75267.1 hypothetical protein PPL_11342 [Heterostelium album PN500]|eukprot:XP_020427401.1 hypothetical protein PPL_11342 [Heterostelium album PN500]